MFQKPKPASSVFQLIWLLHVARWAGGCSNRKRHWGALRLIFPYESVAYSVFVFKRGGTILLALNRDSVRLVSSGMGDTLGSAAVKYGIRGCQRFLREVLRMHIQFSQWTEMNDKWGQQEKHINTALKTIKPMSLFGSVSTLSPRPRTCLPWSSGCRYRKWSPGSVVFFFCLSWTAFFLYDFCQTLSSEFHSLWT